MFILIISIGIVSAHENDTDIGNEPSGAISQSPGEDIVSDTGIDDIEKLIENTEDNGLIHLEGKEYDSDANKTILIEKNLTFEGIEGKTILNGNSFTLTFNTSVPDKKDDEIKIGFVRGGYEILNTGKTLTFKNITFTNINIKTWHEMNFINCNFINSTLTSRELDNDFEKCNFKDSAVLISNYLGIFPQNCTPYNCKISDCEFINSSIASKETELNTYIMLVGSAIFQTINTMEIANSTFSRSDLKLNYYKTNITGCSFDEGNWTGYSSIYNIDSTSFKNQNLDYYYSVLNMTSSKMNNSSFELTGGYYSRGNAIYLDKCEVNICEIKIDEGMYSRKSLLNISNSNLNTTYIDSTYSDIYLINATLNKIEMRLLHSDIEFENTTLIDNEKPSKAITSYEVNFTLKNSYFVNDTGKYELNKLDFEFDNIEEMSYNQKEFYYVGEELIICLKNFRGDPVSDVQLTVKDLDTQETYVNKTDENGTMRYLLQRGGNLNLMVSTGFGSSNYGRHEYVMAINLTVYPISIDINVNSISTTYGVKTNLMIGLTSNETNSTLNGFKLSIEIFTGKKSKTYEAETKSNGTATFNIPVKLASGKHKAIITTRDLVSKEITITVKKAKTVVKAPKVTSRFKKSKYFKISVKNSKTKKAVSNVKVKIKVYTGKKYKTFTVKTNKKGIAKLNTKSLKTGKHKVVVSSANSNYKISAKSEIKIKK